MRVVYLHPNLVLPSYKAHTIQILNTCIGLVREGIGVDLWAKQWDESLYEFYGCEHDSHLRIITYHPSAYLVYKRIPDCYFYMRDAREAARLLSLKKHHKKPIIYETHQNVDLRGLPLERRVYVQRVIADYQRVKDFGWSENMMRYFLRTIDGIVCINESYKRTVEKEATVLQLKDVISTKRCDIYHLLSAEICDICEKTRILGSFDSPMVLFVVNDLLLSRGELRKDVISLSSW